MKTMPRYALLVLMWTCLATSQAQAGGAAETFKNAEPSKSPLTWSDREYLPAEKNGDTLLRIGLSGVGNFRPYPYLTPAMQGNVTCDLEFLYYAKANVTPTPEDLEDCALKEERINAELTGNKRDVLNAFVKKDVVAEWTPRMLERINFLKTKDRFYFRPPNAKVSGYNSQTGGFDFSMILGNWNLTTYYRGRSDYTFVGPRIDELRNALAFNLVLPDATARKLESATRAFGLIDVGMVEFHFKLDMVMFSSLPGKSTVKRPIYYISKVGWVLPFFAPEDNGVRTELSSGISGG